MSGRIPVCEPHLWGNEKRYVAEALDGGWISSSGEFLRRFERSPRLAFAGDYLVAPSADGALASGLRAAAELERGL